MLNLEQRFHQLRNVVLGLSGADREVLDLVATERTRFESLGWAILITGGVAAVSMWFALSSAVGINGFLALPIALVWGLVIIGIDRWLIVSMPVDSNRKFLLAIPRLVLALLLGTLISTPLVLRVFQSEVNAQIAKMQQQNYSTFLQQQQASNVAKQVGTYSSQLQYLNNVIATHGASTANTASDPQLATYNAQLTKIDGEITHWTTLKNQYYQNYVCQLYGGAACPKKGNGPAAKTSLANYKGASQEVNTLKAQANQVQGQIARRDAQLTSNSKADEEARYQQALTQQPIVKNEYDAALQRENQLQASFFASNQASHGILMRLEALSELSDGNFTVTAARFLLFLLFLVIECLPVTVKLLQRPGLYEEALRHARDAERRDVRKYYRSRSRVGGSGVQAVGPAGTAMLTPALIQVEPEYRLDEIWRPAQAHSAAPVPPGEQPSGDDGYGGDGYGDGGYPGAAGGYRDDTYSGADGYAADDGLDFADDGFGDPAAEDSYGTGGQSRDGRTEPIWRDGARWHAHWRDQRPADKEPPAQEATRVHPGAAAGIPESGSPAVPGPDSQDTVPGYETTRHDLGAARPEFTQARTDSGPDSSGAAATRADGAWPASTGWSEDTYPDDAFPDGLLPRAPRREEPLRDEPYRDEPYQDERYPGGGEPLSWDEDE